MYLNSHRTSNLHFEAADEHDSRVKYERNLTWFVIRLSGRVTLPDRSLKGCLCVCCIHPPLQSLYPKEVVYPNHRDQTAICNHILVSCNSGWFQRSNPFTEERDTTLRTNQNTYYTHRGVVVVIYLRVDLWPTQPWTRQCRPYILDRFSTSVASVHQLHCSVLSEFSFDSLRKLRGKQLLNEFQRLGIIIVVKSSRFTIPPWK